jgi:hypothetical protein
MHGAETIFELAVKDSLGSAWQFLASITLSVFALEAYLNYRALELSKQGHLGVPDYGAFERINPKQKIDQLRKGLKVSFPGGWGGMPLQTVQRAIKLRNEVAHPKVVPKSDRAKPIRIRPEELDRVMAHDDRIAWKQPVGDKAFAEALLAEVWRVMDALHHADPRSEFDLRRGPPQMVSAKLVME